LDCIVAGDANIDLLMDGVIQLQIGKEQLAGEMSMKLGGSSAITAHNLARMGVRVAFVGVVGKDAFGQFVHDQLEKAGLDLSFLKLSPKEKTGLTVWHSKNGERASVTYAGSIATMRAAHISPALKRARHLHTGAYFLLEGFHPGAAALFRSARRAGLTTSLDCNFDPAEQWNSNIRAVLRHTNIFFPNEAEALRITKTKTVEKAAAKLAEDVPIVAIKCGERGVLMCAEGSTWLVAAVPSHVVDTTGAGDSFNAGFLSRFVRGGHLGECAQAGVEAAARCISFVGGTAAFERRS
jgi:sugar/nucleoside kinase (ribokinase family)